jgi:hypothetical protein
MIAEKVNKFDRSNRMGFMQHVTASIDDGRIPFNVEGVNNFLTEARARCLNIYHLPDVDEDEDGPDGDEDV